MACEHQKRVRMDISPNIVGFCLECSSFLDTAGNAHAEMANEDLNLIVRWMLERLIGQNVLLNRITDRLAKDSDQGNERHEALKESLAKQQEQQRIMAEIQTKLAEIGEVQAEHDSLEQHAIEANSSAWDGSLRAFRDRIAQLKREIEELKSSL